MKTTGEIFVRILTICWLIVSAGGLAGCGGNPFDNMLETALKDSKPPSVTSRYPSQKDVNVPVNVKISVVMWTGSDGSGVDAATVNSSTYIVSDNNNKTVAGHISVNLQDFFTFTPDNDLEHSTTYTVRLTTGIRGADGQAMLYDYVFSFTTSPF